jgi:retinol dehydrogenase-14
MHDANIDDMSGKTVLITGGTSGIGERSAAALARRGARVILTGRDATRAAAAAALLREETGGAVFGMGLDLESLADVRRFAAEFLREHPRLDVLVNNAGAGYPERRTTPEGLEASLAINHFGPFLLTHLLLGALQAAAPARVIFVNSGLHRMAKLDWDDLQYERNYKGFPDAYGRAKLVSLLCAYELARQFEPLGVSVHVADPGMAATNYGKTWTGLTRLFYYTLLRPFQSTPDNAARSTVALATDPSYARRSGLYVAPPGKEIKSSPASYDRAAGAKLIALSERLVGLRAS